MESVSRMSSMLDAARDLTVEAAQSVGSSRAVNLRRSMPDLSFVAVKKLLDSRTDREILEGLRKVISMMYRSKPCLAFFSAVVKNVASPNIEIKKLVYIYLLQYAETEPDLALLSINTIQKSLTDQNPQVRALALRVMSGIKVPVISQIVSLAIKRGITDMSPHVRKAAALAVSKCYRLDPSTEPQLVEYLSMLLGDKQYFVVGPAVMSYLEVCPQRLDLIHKHFKGLTKKLVDMDEWSQLHTLRLLTSYARQCFPMKMKRARTKPQRGFDDDESRDKDGESTGKEVQVLDPDLELFLQACKPLLWGRNSAVVVAAVRSFYYLGDVSYLDMAIGPLVALLRGPLDIQQIVMYDVVAICLVRPEIFPQYLRHFLVKATDSLEILRLKFEVMTLIFSHCEAEVKEIITFEFEHFTRNSDDAVMKESVQAIGRCAQADQIFAKRCLAMLFAHLSSEHDALISESVTVIRHLIQQGPEAHTKTVIRLAKHLDIIRSPEARASIIWLVGEYADTPDEDNIAPDVLRILAKGFAEEAEATKLQIILLAAKVYLHYLLRKPSQAAPGTDDDEASASTPAPNPNVSDAEDGITEQSTASAAEDDTAPTASPIPLLWIYIQNLTRYDTSYDLRDRMRMYQALLATPSSTHLASLLLLAPKPVPIIPSPSLNRRDILIGSSSLVLGLDPTGNGGIAGYEGLPEWVKEGDEPDPKLRNTLPSVEDGHGRDNPAVSELGGAVAAQQLDKVDIAGKGRTLDEWLAEDEEENDDEDEEEEEEDDEEGSTEEETESESEDEDDRDGEDSTEDRGEGERLVTK